MLTEKGKEPERPERPCIFASLRLFLGSTADSEERGRLHPPRNEKALAMQAI